MYLIGGGFPGYSTPNPQQFIRGTEIFNMADDNYESYFAPNMDLNRDRGYVKTILVNNIIYAFGGLKNYTAGGINEYENTWEYFNLSAPTSSPSMAPTIDTLSPTMDTSVPSMSPSMPTLIPSLNPTMTPTMEPTKNPTFTMSPTTEPTITPTMEPTLGPTISPTTGKKDNNKALAYGLGFGLGFGIPILIIIILGLIFYFKFDESEQKEYINRYCSCCVSDSNKSGNTKDIETQGLTSDRGDGGHTTN